MESDKKQPLLNYELEYCLLEHIKVLGIMQDAMKFGMGKEDIDENN